MVTGVVWFGGLSAGALYLLGVYADVRILLLVFIGGSLAGDLILALVFEAFAPSHVTLRPGERTRRHDELTEVGTVVSGFAASPSGTIRVQGEIWQARCRHRSPLTLDHGSRVRVVERDGLTLLITPL